MTYEIVKNVELGVGGGYPSKYPFKSMEVGDTFFLPKDEREKVVSSSSYHGARNRVKFSVRKYSSEQYPDGYACKRIA